MRVLWLQPGTDVEALATEEAILRCRLENGPPDTLCFWQGRKSVVVGCDINRDNIDLNLCKKLGMPIYRRQSGGGAIYQEGGNLNYSLIAAIGRVLPTKDVQRAGKIIDSLVANAISKMGLNAKAMDQGGVSVEGRKVSGSARFLLWGHLLHHGVIAVSTKLKLLRKLILVNKVPVATLENELGKKIEIEELASRICAEFSSRFNTPLCPGARTEAEEHMAEKLLEEKYLTREWNRGLHA